MTKTKNLKKAIEAAKVFIANIVKNKEVDIHTFKDAQGGLRVVEVSVGISSGYSWMRSECMGGVGAIILAVEDFILTYDIKPWRPEGWSDDLDEHADAKYKLEEAIKS